MFVSQVLDFYTLLNRIYHLYPRNKLETNLIRLAGRWQPKWPSGPSRPTRGQPHAQQAGPHTARGGGARARPSPFPCVEAEQRAGGRPADSAGGGHATGKASRRAATEVRTPHAELRLANEPARLGSARSGSLG
jgi:hypothetical protein